MGIAVIHITDLPVAIPAGAVYLGMRNDGYLQFSKPRVRVKAKSRWISWDEYFAKGGKVMAIFRHQPIFLQPPIV